MPETTTHESVSPPCARRAEAPRIPSATVVHADAYDAAAALSPGSIDVVVTSPPYWGLRTYGFTNNTNLLDEWIAESDRADSHPGYEWYREHGGALGQEPYPEWYVAHLVEMFERVRPSLKSDGSLWVNLGDTYFARWSSIRSDGRQGLSESARTRRRTPSGGWRHDKQLLMLPARFAIAMQDAGWILRNDLIWSKPNPVPRPEQDRLRLSHEHFFHFVQRTPRARPTYYYELAEAEAGALDVVVSTDRGQSLAGHGATFPESIIRPRIRSCSRPDGTLLDPFCGSGTSLAAAVSEGRDAIGFEFNPEFARASANRVCSHATATGSISPTRLLDVKGLAAWTSTHPKS